VSRFEYFLQWLGLWFLVALVSWSYLALRDVGKKLTGQQNMALLILAILGILVAIASFLNGIRSLYNSLKE